MKKILIILNIVALLASLIWLMTNQDWEPLVTSLGLLSSLITLVYSNSEEKGKIKMKQKGGSNSKNYQSVGDININSNNDK
ncbi:hypothetical protein [Pontibacter mucosus]|uniref:hypothetical protein n=1 Tax=Pontibacter mucosus TaxID=1649266 RepID=UPI001B8735BD|nr:hypothetical protein [Pontibacter mucosus]